MVDLVLGERVGAQAWRARSAVHGQVLVRFVRRSRRPVFEALSEAGLPFIPRIHAVQDHTSTTALVVEEWLRGPSLAAARGRIGPEQCAGLLSHLAERLAALHAAGVWHGDLKPENIAMLQDPPRLYLVDLEHAQLPQGAGRRPSLGFTAAYATREQVYQRELTPTTDVRALGLIGAELLLGHHPIVAHAAHTTYVGLARIVADTSIEFDARCPLGRVLAPMVRCAPGDRPSVHEAVELLRGLV